MSDRSSPRSSNRFPSIARSIATWLLMLVPIGLVLATVFTYALNLPYWDDYLVQAQLLLLKAQPSGRQKLLHLFDQHWEHRIVWTRLLFAGWYKLTGSLNYYGLTLFGVSGLVVLFGLLATVFRQTTKLPWVYLLPVPFWLFTLQSHENLLWAMASIQNFWVLVFALGSFYALTNQMVAGRWLALALGVLATYTSGNGALVLIAGGIVLVWQTLTNQDFRKGTKSLLQRWGFVIVWVVIAVASIGGYFHQYHRITFFPSPFRYPFIDWIKAYFVFFGAFADPFPYSGAGAYGYENLLLPTILLGALLVSIAGYLIVTDMLKIGSPLHKSRRQTSNQPGIESSAGINHFFLATLLFLLATAAITVYSRVGFAGPGYLLQGRYKVYSALMLSVVYLYVLTRFGQSRQAAFRWTWAGVLVLSIGQNLFSDYLCLEGIINQHRRTTAAYFNYLVNTPSDQQRALSAVFVPTEPPFFSGQTRQLSAKSWFTVPATEKFDHFDTQRFMYWINKSNSVNPILNRPTDGTYIYMTSGQHTYLFPARPLRPTPTALNGFNGYFRPQGIRAQVLQEHLEPGQYRFGLLTNRGGHLRLAMTNQTVTFTSL